MRCIRGFSVLEMVVAMAILAAVMIPMLTLQNQLFNNFLRYDASFNRLTLTQNAMAVLQNVNPASETEGDLALGAKTRLRWRAEPISRTHPNALQDGTSGKYRVALYEVEAEIYDTVRQQMITSWTFERLGWYALGDAPAQDQP